MNRLALGANRKYIFTLLVYGVEPLFGKRGLFSPNKWQLIGGAFSPARYGLEAVNRLIDSPNREGISRNPNLTSPTRLLRIGRRATVPGEPASQVSQERQSRVGRSGGQRVDLTVYRTGFALR